MNRRQARHLRHTADVQLVAGVVVGGALLLLDVVLMLHALAL